MVCFGSIILFTENIVPHWRNPYSIPPSVGFNFLHPSTCIFPCAPPAVALQALCPSLLLSALSLAAVLHRVMELVVWSLFHQYVAPVSGAGGSSRVHSLSHYPLCLNIPLCCLSSSRLLKVLYLKHGASSFFHSDTYRFVFSLFILRFPNKMLNLFSLLELYLVFSHVLFL